MSAFSPFDIQARPNRYVAQALSFVFFLVCLGMYVHVSKVRHAENPEDRITPNAAQLKAGIHASVLEPAEEDDYVAPDGASKWERFHHSMIWRDTLSSGRRFGARDGWLAHSRVDTRHSGLARRASPICEL